MKNLLCLILALLLVFPPLPAQAWSEGGHHLIAVMAFRKLPADKKAELIRILKAHPRFEQDFKLPKKVRNEDEWYSAQTLDLDSVHCSRCDVHLILE